MRTRLREPPTPSASPLGGSGCREDRVASSRGHADYSAARQDTSSDRDCRFDQKEESSMIGRDLFNIPCRICRRPTIHRTRTRHPERKSKSEGHCGSYRAGRERRNSQETTSTQALLPTSTKKKKNIKKALNKKNLNKRATWEIEARTRAPPTGFYLPIELDIVENEPI